MGTWEKTQNFRIQWLNGELSFLSSLLLFSSVAHFSWFLAQVFFKIFIILNRDPFLAEPLPWALGPSLPSVITESSESTIKSEDDLPKKNALFWFSDQSERKKICIIKFEFISKISLKNWFTWEIGENEMGKEMREQKRRLKEERELITWLSLHRFL